MILFFVILNVSFILLTKT